MITINTIDGQKFSINGVNYFKNFMPYAVGVDKINIVNAYNDFVLIPSPTIYSDFIIDGVTYASQALLQDALLPVLFSRDTLGSDATKQDKDISLYGDIPLPLEDTDKLWINRAGTWYKVDKSELGGGGETVQVYKTITGNTTLDNSFHGAIVLVKANATITIEDGLVSDFNCVCRTYSGVTATFVTGGTATIDAESDGTTLNESKMCSLFVDGTDNYILSGTE